MGSKQAGLHICEALIKQLPVGMLKAILCPNDVADCRTELQKFERLAKEYNIPFHVINKTTETIDVLKIYNTSIVLVHGWYQLIPVEQFPKTLFLGFHYSPLPRYRGNAPLVWQIINGETRLGISLFQLTSGMDEGDLVDQRFFNLDRYENISSALAKANSLAQQMLSDLLSMMMSNNVKLIKQASEAPSYCGLRMPEDGRIDWKRHASKVHDFIRAQSKPYPGAFTYLPDKRKLTVWSAVEETDKFYGVPGSVVAIKEESVTVACSDGAIRILALEVDGVEYSPNQILKSIKTRLS